MSESLYIQLSVSINLVNMFLDLQFVSFVFFSFEGFLVI